MKAVRKGVLELIAKLRTRAAVLMAQVGIRMLKASGLFTGYFANWRWAVFDEAQRAGLHILPVHYYSPVPDTAHLTLDDQAPVYFAAEPETLQAATDDLQDLVDRFGERFDEIAARPSYADSEQITQFRFGKAPYRSLEAELLYGLIRARKPSQIIEIGSGHTTLLMAEAIRAEEDYAPVFECIEPYRPDYLKTLPPEVTRFNDTPLQSVPLDRFRNLQAGDILFIDSSHVVSYGSDVVYEMSVILPRLAPGVLVHFHDIFLPYEYPTDWMTDAKLFWNEQYMLSAMLQDNARYKVRFPLHQLYRERREDMQRMFPLLAEPYHRPGAYWIGIA